MKKSLVSLILVSLFATACGGDESKDAVLKKKMAEFEVLRKEIYDLEIEIAKGDSTKSNTGKPVRISTLAISSFKHSIDIQGRVDADETVFVGPQMPGLVKNVYVHTGDNVRAGQVLATLDANAMSQQLAGLKLQRDLAKDISERQKKLLDQQIGTEMQYLQSKTMYEALEKQISAMEQQIGMANLKAPIDGVVDAINLKVGELASPGFSNIIVVNTSKLRVKGEVAEGYVTMVKTGNPVSLYFPDANKTVDSKITYSGRMINNLNRTFSVEVALPSREEGIVPNMISVIKINDYSNDSALVVPLSAIQETSDGKTFVFVAVKGKDNKMVAEKRMVTYQMTYNGFAEIKPGQGLNPGDQLITDGSADLNQGDIVSAK